VKSIPTLFLIFRGNIMDTVTGPDDYKLDQMVKTALLVESAQHDEGIMLKVLSEAETRIESGDYKSAEQILRDG
jgi:hypothetical protein